MSRFRSVPTTMNAIAMARSTGDRVSSQVSATAMAEPKAPSELHEAPVRVKRPDHRDIVYWWQ